MLDNIKRDDLDIGDEIELNNENGTVIATRNDKNNIL
jgi:hypothetical protein